MNLLLLHWQGRFFTTEPPGKSIYVYIKFKYTHNLPVYVFILKLMEYGIMPSLTSRISMGCSWHIVSHQKLLVIILISMKTLYYKLPSLSIGLPNLISSVLHRLRSFNSNYSGGSPSFCAFYSQKQIELQVSNSLNIFFFPKVINQWLILSKKNCLSSLENLSMA